QPAPFVGRQLARIAAGQRVGAAMHAGERARPRHFPDHEKRRTGEIESGDVATGHAPASPGASELPMTPVTTVAQRQRQEKTCGMTRVIGGASDGFYSA